MPSFLPQPADVVEHCSVCDHEVVAIAIMVDGRPLRMRSCSNCDTRSWDLEGDPVELGKVLTEVGMHVGRRR